MWLSCEASVTVDDVTISCHTGPGDLVEVSSLRLQFVPSSSDEQLMCSNFTVIDDSIYEGTETFFVHLEIETKAVSVHIPRATVYINDNDVITVGIQSADYQTMEGDEQVEVCLVMAGHTDTNVNCSVSTLPGSATQGQNICTAYQ